MTPTAQIDWAEWERDLIEVTHHCPPEGKSLTPCCSRTPFELPRTHRMTLDPELVTCVGAKP